MPFIPQCPGPAQSAEAEMPGDSRSSKPTLFHRQGMRPHAELHQQLYPGNGHWKLKVRHSLQLTGTQKPCKVCAELCPFGGSCSWGHIQTTPNPAELTLHVRLKPEGVQARYARRRKGRGHAKAAVKGMARWLQPRITERSVRSWRIWLQSAILSRQMPVRMGQWMTSGRPEISQHCSPRL